MSDVKDDFMKQLNAEDDILQKKKEIEKERINVLFDRVQENKKRYEAAKNGKYGTLSDEEANKIAQESTEYMEAAAKSMTFINSLFKNTIPFFAKNMILIGAKTGEGKTTAVANIVRRVISEINPATGRPGRVLILTNEENQADFYNRITCLMKGWHYVNHDLFTKEQHQVFSEMIKVLRHKVTVIDDEHIPGGGATTTPEGLELIFQGLIRDGEFYDVVILDYYQGIIESSKDLSLNEYQAQRVATNVLEKYRKIYPAPIVVMAQINPPEDSERPSPFQVRIQGTKKICTRATTIIEMIAHRKEMMTEWFFHKGRYASSTGESIKTGYKNGLFVKYDDAFRADVQRVREAREENDFNKEIGIKVEKKEEQKETVNG